jgi:deoxyribose-phosphate aldolase
MRGTNDVSDLPVVHRPQDLAAYIDHTLLKPESTEKDIDRLCEEALAHHFKAVCVNPIFVARTRERLGSSPVLTASVIGFPLGASLSSTKVFETYAALRDGAAEIDMVMRIDLAKQGRWKEVEADIHEVVKAASGATVKVILETGLLSAAEIEDACRVSESAGAGFVKTATGFLGRGASLDDIEIMKRSCSAKMQIKASGGVKTFEQAQALIVAGATRIGTSSGVALVSGTTAQAGY